MKAKTPEKIKLNDQEYVHDICFASAINMVTRDPDLYRESPEFELDPKYDFDYTSKIDTVVRLVCLQEKENIEIFNKKINQAKERFLTDEEKEDIFACEKQVMDMKEALHDLQEMNKKIDKMIEAPLGTYQPEEIKGLGEKMIKKEEYITKLNHALVENSEILQEYIDTCRKKTILEYLKDKTNDIIHPEQKKTKRISALNKLR